MTAGDGKLAVEANGSSCGSRGAGSKTAVDHGSGVDEAEPAGGNELEAESGETAAEAEEMLTNSDDQ